MIRPHSAIFTSSVAQNEIRPLTTPMERHGSVDTPPPDPVVLLCRGASGGQRNVHPPSQAPWTLRLPLWTLKSPPPGMECRPPSVCPSALSHSMAPHPCHQVRIAFRQQTIPTLFPSPLPQDKHRLHLWMLRSPKTKPPRAIQARAARRARRARSPDKPKGIRALLPMLPSRLLQLEGQGGGSASYIVC